MELSQIKINEYLMAVNKGIATVTATGHVILISIEFHHL
jgi:hypothetical protein